MIAPFASAIVINIKFEGSFTVFHQNFKRLSVVYIFFVVKPYKLKMSANIYYVGRSP